MTTELKVTVTDETLNFLREYFPEGISDADRARIAFSILRHTVESEGESLETFLRQQGLVEDLDFEIGELYIKGVKRALLESDEVDLTDLGGLMSDAEPDDS